MKVRFFFDFMICEIPNSRPHIAVIFDNFGPYHQARLKGAASVCRVHGIQLSGSSRDYAWVTEGGDGFGISTIVHEGPCSQVPKHEFKTRLLATLERLNPGTIAIPGWSSLGAFVALDWAKRNKVPVILMSESTAWDEPRTAWKEWVKKRIVGLASSALVGGHPHADYMRQLGMPEDRIFLGYDTVDNAYFATESQKHRSTAAPDIRPYFLSSNRFIEKKNLFRLLEAYAGYSGAPKHRNTETPIWDLCLLGDGELKPRLLAHCHSLGLHVAECAPWDNQPTTDNRPPTTVFFPGFRQIDELPRFYAHSGAFVHASTTEQWGLVVNESMASGLPVIVSNRVGCASDLVEDGVNGFTFDPYKVDELTELLCKISDSGFPLEDFGKESIRIIKDWGPERFAKGLREACVKALQISTNHQKLHKTLAKLDWILLWMLAHRK